MVWYLLVMGKLHGDECLIYIFTGEVLNGTPKIFTNSQYHCWFKELRDNFSPVLFNTTHKNVNFKSSLRGSSKMWSNLPPKHLKIITSVISVPKMAHNFYLATLGLGIKEMNNF